MAVFTRARNWFGSALISGGSVVCLGRGGSLVMRETLAAGLDGLEARLAATKAAPEWAKPSTMTFQPAMKATIWNGNPIASSELLQELNTFR